MKGNGRRASKRVPKGFEELAGYCRLLSDNRDSLSGRVEKIRGRRVKYTKRLIPGLKSRVARLAATKGLIRKWIDAHGERFTKPRTRILHGVKVGLRKKPGQLLIPDESRTVDLIREKLPAAQQKLLLVTTTKIQKSALKKLSAAELASVGASIVAVADEVVVTFPKDTVGRLADALQSDFEADGGVS